MYTQTILKCLAKILKLNEEDACNISADTELTQLGLTSIDFISLVVELENALEIEIRDSDLIMENFKTLKCIIETLSAYFPSGANMKKCLVLDADHVLWKGISGEETIVVDEDVLYFQKSLLELYNRGVLLCLCSKNEIGLIEESFSNSHMLLTKEHFVSFIANRFDKASNILAIADELNLTTDQFVFADDSDYELEYVKINIPDIETIKVDYTSLGFVEKINRLFSNVHPSSDLNRTQLYREQKERQKAMHASTSIAEYNASLETEVICRRALKQECERLAELSERTHQFNLSAKQYMEDELIKMLADPIYTVLSLAARDKFGDMGIVGMAIAKRNVIEAFMLSCRVFDRGFEYILLNKMKEIINEPLYGIFLPNSKNVRYSNFYLQNGVTSATLSSTL